MKNMRFVAMAMVVILAMVLAGCAGQGEAGNQGAGSDMTGAPGAQQTDMPGTGNSGATGGADTTGSGTDTTGTDATGSDTDTGVSGTGGQGTGTGSGSDLSGGTSSTGTTGSGSTNTGGTGATGAMTDTTSAGDTSGAAGAGSMDGDFMGRWNFDMPEGFESTTAEGADDAEGDSRTLNVTYNENEYVFVLERGDAGDANSLEEWVQADLETEGMTDVAEDEQESTTVGNFDATIVSGFTAQNSEYEGAVCAARAYVWGMGNAEGAGNSGNSQGKSGANDNNAKNLLVVTAYQMSGEECDADEVLNQFLGSFRGGSDSGMSGSDSAGATPTP